VNNDHAHLIGELLDEIKPRKIVRVVILSAYAAGYEKNSDGITLMPELEFGNLKMKNPVGVGHDWLYYMGWQNPFLPTSVKSEWGVKLWADNWFHDGLNDFGHPYRANLWWFGLRFGGWRAWKMHRDADHPRTRRYDTATGRMTSTQVGGMV
jgi:hypothetical protein